MGVGGAWGVRGKSKVSKCVVTGSLGMWGEGLP